MYVYALDIYIYVLVKSKKKEEKRNKKKVFLKCKIKRVCLCKIPNVIIIFILKNIQNIFLYTYNFIFYVGILKLSNTI